MIPCIVCEFTLLILSLQVQLRPINIDTAVPNYLTVPGYCRYIDNNNNIFVGLSVIRR